VAIEPCLLFKALELSSVVGHFIKGVAPALYLSILDSIELVSIGVLEGVLVECR
jgi:hypothetical protein